MAKRCASDFKDYEDVCTALEHVLRTDGWDARIWWDYRGFQVTLTKNGCGPIVTHDHDWTNAVVAAILHVDDEGRSPERYRRKEA